MVEGGSGRDGGATAPSKVAKEKRRKGATVGTGSAIASSEVAKEIKQRRKGAAMLWPP